jgi:dTDP-4-amino-4,6-dideoxygalactose transaminase
MAHDRKVAAALRSALEASPFGWRRWYESGLHDMSHFTARPRDEMTVTADLGERLIGIPMAPDLSKREIASIMRLLALANSTNATSIAQPGMETVFDGPYPMAGLADTSALPR